MSALERYAEFELKIAELFEKKGYHVTRGIKMNGKSGITHQIDVLAEFIAPLHTSTVIIEAKSYKSNIDKDIIMRLIQIQQDLSADRVILATTSKFTLGARTTANQYNNLELWGREKIVSFLGKMQLMDTSNAMQESKQTTKKMIATHVSLKQARCSTEKLDVFDVIALTIHANNNKITSKTTLQKLIYFNMVMIKDLDISDYVHHYYGPFSHEVSIALDDMSEFSYIDQNIISSYYETYSYNLTKNGIKYAEFAKGKYPKEFEIISTTLKTCEKYCGLKSASLSYAAKIHYVLENSRDQSQDKYLAEDVKTIAKNFGWNISSHDASEGFELLEKLGLDPSA